MADLVAVYDDVRLHFGRGMLCVHFLFPQCRSGRAGSLRRIRVAKAMDAVDREFTMTPLGG
jgi:hypothetical protein